MAYVLIVFYALHGGGEGVAIKRYDSRHECIERSTHTAALLPGKTITRAECRVAYQPSPEEQVQGWLVIQPFGR